MVLTKAMNGHQPPGAGAGAGAAAAGGGSSRAEAALTKQLRGMHAQQLREGGAEYTQLLEQRELASIGYS
jgi:hypothetical protein